MSDSRSTLVLGTRKGLFVMGKKGGDWKVRTVAHLGIPIPYATIDSRTGLLWACLDHGHWGQKLERSADRGATWEALAAPKYPEGEKIKDDLEAATRYLWILQPALGDQPDRIYIGTEPGGLFQSDDGGASFKLVRSLWDHPSRKESWFGGGRDQAGIHSICIDPNDTSRVLVGVSVAGVFESTDSLETWAPRNKGLRADFLPDPDAEVGHDPHLMVASPSDFNVLWQQNHCGIFRSTDGAKTWTDISEKGGPANFGFAIAVHKQSAETAWVVPAISDETRVAIDGKLVVCRTENGGKTWTGHRKGLPQADAYDVTFRHALDLTGETLAFGTTTGNLFLSDDGGDSWRSLGSHFPPIYSVRFV